MRFIEPADRALAETLSELGRTNPFLPERVALEQRALGAAFVESPAVWSVRAEHLGGPSPNIAGLEECAAAVATRLRDRIVAGAVPTPADRTLYEDVVLYLLYNRVAGPFWRAMIEPTLAGSPPQRIECWDAFRTDFRHFLGVGGAPAPDDAAAAHVFATFFQIRRAFHLIFWEIIGGSMAAARLRAAVWESIFTRDMRRYARTLHARMGDITTLVIGPSGTGKELVARAIALSRYVPFDVRARRFTADFATLFHPLNLSALSPTLIESELFGHRRGAFTGAIEDRVGWLEACEPLGTVFLDEVGEVDGAIQVKLLRVLQSRRFERLGDSKPRSFAGKLIAATNRDLGAEMRAGRVRSDFYYRLCADIVETPTLAAQLGESPDELPNLVRVITGRIVGEEEADAVAAEVTAWIDAELGREYAWPGNVRELEQCVRNVLVRGAYRPQRPGGPPASDARTALTTAIAAGTLTAEELVARYASLVFAETGSYQETARRLRLDRRTVRAKVDPSLVASFRAR